jgi:hypothetical protein
MSPYGDPRRSSRMASLASIVVLLSSPAVAGCRENPHEVRLGQETVKLKTYNCGDGSTASGVKVEFLSILKRSGRHYCLWQVYGFHYEDSVR